MKKNIKSKNYHTGEWRQIEGRNAVREVLRAGADVDKIFLEIGVKFDAKLDEIHQLAVAAQIPIEKVIPKKLNKISKTDNHHQGVIAMARALEEKSVKQVYQEVVNSGRIPFFIILAGVLYEHNLGAVMRSAESCGADGVIVPNRAIGVTPVVSRTAVGAQEYIPLMHDNIFNTLKFFKDQAMYIIAACEDSQKPLYKADFSKPLALIIGAEDAGISNGFDKYINDKVRIPMFGKIGSLNLSVAAAVCMYEVVRQRRYNRIDSGK